MLFFTDKNTFSEIFTKNYESVNEKWDKLVFYQVLHYIIVILTRDWNLREKKTPEKDSNPQSSNYEATLLSTKPLPHISIIFQLVYGTPCFTDGRRAN